MNTKSEKISKIDTFLDKTDKEEREDTNRQLQKKKRNNITTDPTDVKMIINKY